MIKEALGDRFLQISIAIFLIVSILFSFYIYDNSTINLAFGRPLTDSQKSRAISIAMADPFAIGQAGPYVNSSRGALHVKDVLAPSPFHEVGPDTNRTRYLPSVEIIIGNESESGTNIFAFVDLDQGRVAYVGYTMRVYTTGPQPIDSYDNFSIADTGYHAGDILTGEQRDKAIRTAMEGTWLDESVSNGTRYQVVGDIPVSYAYIYKDNGPYIGAYPVIEFREEASIYVASQTVYVYVDPDRGKVIDSFSVVNTPVQK